MRWRVKSLERTACVVFLGRPRGGALGTATAGGGVGAVSGGEVAKPARRKSFDQSFLTSELTATCGVFTFALRFGELITPSQLTTYLSRGQLISERRPSDDDGGDAHRCVVFLSRGCRDDTSRSVPRGCCSLRHAQHELEEQSSRVHGGGD